MGRMSIGVQRQLAGQLAMKWRRSYSVVCDYVKSRINIATVRATNRFLRGSRIPERLLSNRFQQWEDGVGFGLFKQN